MDPVVSSTIASSTATAYPASRAAAERPKEVPGADTATFSAAVPVTVPTKTSAQLIANTSSSVKQRFVTDRNDILPAAPAALVPKPSPSRAAITIPTSVSTTPANRFASIVMAATMLPTHRTSAAAVTRAPDDPNGVPSAAATAFERWLQWRKNREVKVFGTEPYGFQQE